MIRQAKIDDAKKLASIVNRSWQTAYRGLIDDDFLDGLSTEENTKRWIENIKSQSETNNIYVYEDEYDNKIKGVIRFGEPTGKESEKYNAEIHVLYVEPDLKRQGIGTRLFKLAKNYFLDRGKQDLIIWCLKGNMIGMNFYKKMGGKLVQERKDIVKGINVEEVGFEFKLDYDIKLVRPTKEHEEALIEYKKEHFDNGEKIIHACSRWDKLDSYDEWLKLLDECSKKETVPDNWTVSTQFLGVRKRDNKIVGMISIRHALTTPFLRNYAGHIGYGVRPSERRKGYVTQMLQQALKYCKDDLKLDKVMITCDKENEGSRKTIINAGGVLEKEYKTDDGENVQIYWIKL